MIFCRWGDVLKILTLSTHSLHSENNLANCHILCDLIGRELPDIVALQEVNQNISGEVSVTISGHIPVGEVLLKEGNFALCMQRILLGLKLNYQFSWLGMKKGYDRFDEGLAIFSRHPVKEAKSMLLTNTSDYNNFKKRMALIVETDMGVFACCHLGWEDDCEESFDRQVLRVSACQNFKKNVYLMGDFNVTPKSRGYEKIISKGWQDTFFLAEEKIGEATVSGKIDGWEKNRSDMRIDYIFANKKIPVKKSEVLFSDEKLPKISDHFGVMVTL